MAYVYPARMRATRDLLRYRMHLMRKRAELLSHIQNTTSQYNLPAFEKQIAYGSNRAGLPDHFDNPFVRKSIEADLALTEHYDRLLKELELYILRSARQHDPKHGKPKALSILAHKLGRTVYYLLLRDEAFDMQRFLAA